MWYIWPKKTTFGKSLNKKLDHSPFKIKNESIKGIRQLAIFKANPDKTLDKLHWISKMPFQTNSMATIPKIMKLLQQNYS